MRLRCPGRAPAARRPLHPAAVLAAGVLPLVVLAQPAPQVTPRDLRPEAPPAASRPLPAPAPARIPPGADQLSLTPGRIEVVDGFPEFAAATRAGVAPLEGQRVTVAHLYALAEAIEAQYRDAGYLLVRVTVPPQSVKDGEVFRLVVVDGFLEHVDLGNVPEKVRPRVAAMLEPLVGRTHLRDRDLERAITLASRLPGLTLRSTLTPGVTAGASILVIESAYAPFGAQLSIDNRLSKALGPGEFTLQARANQPFGRGEQLYAYVSSNPEPKRAFGSDAPRRVAGGGALIPIGLDGWVVNPELTWSDTRTPATDFVPATDSRFRRYTLRSSYPVIMARGRELTVTGTFDATTQSTAAPDFGVSINEDRLRVLRLGADYSAAIGDEAQLRLSGTLSKGLSGLGARKQADVDASGVAFSRPNADPAFSKIEATAVWDQAVVPLVQSRTVLRVQKSLHHRILPGSELFSLDGEEALSMFTTGSISDDGGWTLREELSRAVAAPDGSYTLLPYVFYAAGRPWSEVPGGAVRGLSQSYGVGVRANVRIFSFSAEYGRRRSHPSDLNGHQLFVKAQVSF